MTGRERPIGNFCLATNAKVKGSQEMSVITFNLSDQFLFVFIGLQVQIATVWQTCSLGLGNLICFHFAGVFNFYISSRGRGHANTHQFADSFAQFQCLLCENLNALATFMVP